jgi:hypothetical protein
MRKKYRVKKHAVTQPLDTSYRLIPLTKGQNAIVDTEDWELLNQFNWAAKWHPKENRFYAVRRGNDGKIKFMHRFLLGEPGGKEVDHKDHNGLNNRRSNLRPCTSRQNKFNSSNRKNNTSGYRGVYFDKRKNKWNVEIRKDGRHIFVGYFSDPKEAARARDRVVREIHGEFAVLNFPLS